MDSSHRASDWGMRNGDPLFTSMISSVSVHTTKCKSLLVTTNYYQHTSEVNKQVPVLVYLPRDSSARSQRRQSTLLDPTTAAYSNDYASRTVNHGTYE